MAHAPHALSRANSAELSPSLDTARKRASHERVRQLEIEAIP